MNRYDWVFVGTRLFGIWMLVTFLGNADTFLAMMIEGHGTARGLANWLMSGVLGWLLASETRVVTDWMTRRDRAMAPTQSQ